MLLKEIALQQVKLIGQLYDRYDKIHTCVCNLNKQSSNEKLKSLSNGVEQTKHKLYEQIKGWQLFADSYYGTSELMTATELKKKIDQANRIIDNILVAVDDDDLKTHVRNITKNE